MNHLSFLRQRITQLQITLPGLRKAQRRQPDVVSFKSDVHNREFQIYNLKRELQRLKDQVAAGELW
jgi:hypothetical protein